MVLNIEGNVNIMNLIFLLNFPYLAKKHFMFSDKYITNKHLFAVYSERYWLCVRQEHNRHRTLKTIMKACIDKYNEEFQYFISI